VLGSETECERPETERQARIRSLNHRFTSTGGIMVHAYDVHDNQPSLANLLRSPHSGRGLKVVSASVVSRRLPYFFMGNELHLRRIPAMGHAGIVVSKAASRRSVLCSYSRDTATIFVGRDCEASGSTAGCVPGCVGSYQPPSGRKRTRTWCNSSATNGVGLEGEDEEQCAQRPEALAQMLASHEQRTRRWLASCKRQHAAVEEDDRESCECVARCCSFPSCLLYNEVILRASGLEQPRAIEAIYFVAQSASASNASFKAGEEAARAAHADAAKLGCDERLPSLVVVDPAKVNAPFAQASVGVAFRTSPDTKRSRRRESPTEAGEPRNPVAWCMIRFARVAREGGEQAEAEWLAIPSADAPAPPAVSMSPSRVRLRLVVSYGRPSGRFIFYMTHEAYVYFQT
jgi:hypothetical protein